jgi:uncharacterized membrane protein YadS
LFVVGFVAAAALRSYGDAAIAAGGRAFGLFDGPGFRSFVHTMGDDVASTALAAAMAAVGWSTSFAKLRALGARPFLLGGLSALVVSGAGLGFAALCGRFVR